MNCTVSDALEGLKIVNACIRVDLMNSQQNLDLPFDTAVVQSYRLILSSSLGTTKPDKYIKANWDTLEVRVHVLSTDTCPAVIGLLEEFEENGYMRVMTIRELSSGGIGGGGNSSLDVRGDDASSSGVLGCKISSPGVDESDTSGSEVEGSDMSCGSTTESMVPSLSAVLGVP